MKAYRLAHLDRVKEYARKYREKRKIEMLEWPRNGKPSYHFPCKKCVFWGITQGALDIHIKLKHDKS